MMQLCGISVILTLKQISETFTLSICLNIDLFWSVDMNYLKHVLRNIAVTIYSQLPQSNAEGFTGSHILSIC